MTSTILTLADFGPMAGSAIPQIEHWLRSPDEHIQLFAGTTILKLDPKRTEFISIVADCQKRNDE